MKILVAATQPPVPPINGIRLPLQRLAHGFADRGHDVMLIALADAEERRQAELPAHWRLLPGPPRATSTRQALWLARATVSGRPMRVDDVASALLPEIEQQLDDFAPDAFFGVGFELAALPRLACPSVLAVLDAVHLNVRAQAAGAAGVRRILFNREARRVRRFEATGYGRFDRWSSFRRRTARLSGTSTRNLQVDVIPNGVDTEEYRSIADVAPTPGRLLLHGTMDYEPNVRAAEFFVEDVLPLVRVDHPDAHVVVVGRSPSKRVRTLEGPHVTVTGEVDEVGHVARVRRRVRLSDGHGHGLEEQAARSDGLRTGLRARPRSRFGVSPRSQGETCSSERVPPSSRRPSPLCSATRRAGRHSAQALDATSSSTTAGMPVTAEYEAVLSRARASRRRSND